ncbi:MAG TPA: NAD(P)-dependent oxidoreductase [Cytophagales bacterium]|nr:NAD(P)-dependent oxidoreductase [Cytophagales bacterium]HAA22804.1 NAD(P)-dependent oxidoreductase [Cytophagales bacterium]HAP65321.1 NAD(P)-dependent oxidoreductase [Cytophagales bacterium]
MSKSVLITGATSGIGKAAAELLATQGYSLILCGRREERLEELAKALSQLTQVKTLVFDVRDREHVFNILKDVGPIDVLINNAGNAHGLSPLHEGDVDDWEAMMDINVKGLLYVTKAITPGMVARKSGHIVNIGSIAGKEAYPGGNVYCASKHAVDAINNSLRMELHTYGIRVSAINPGLVETEFSEVRFKGDADRAKKVYQGFDPLTAQDIAETIAFVISRPAHVNLSDIIIFPTAQAASTMVHKENG